MQTRFPGHPPWLFLIISCYHCFCIVGCFAGIRISGFIYVSLLCCAGAGDPVGPNSGENCGGKPHCFWWLGPALALGLQGSLGHGTPDGKGDAGGSLSSYTLLIFCGGTLSRAIMASFAFLKALFTSGDEVLAGKTWEIWPQHGQDGWEAPRTCAGVVGEGSALCLLVLCSGLLWGPGSEPKGRGKAKLSFTKASEHIKSPILVALKKREWDDLGVQQE